MAYDLRYPHPPGGDSLPPLPPPPHEFGGYRRDVAAPPNLPQRPSSRGGDSYRPATYPDLDLRDSRDPRDIDFSYQAGRDSRQQDSHNPRSRPVQSHESLRPPQADFTFRADKPAGIQDSPYDSYRPGGNHNRDRGYQASAAGRNGHSRWKGADQQAHGKGSRRDRRGMDRPRGSLQPYRFSASDRPMLRALHSSGPEQSFVDTERGVTYRALEDLSDSDEAEMDISGDESGEPSAKRVRTSLDHAVSENVTPRWSNPDPYTALPPPDATQQKKKDVVHLIRKARIQPEKEAKSSVPAEAEEFISCDFDDSDDGQTEDKSGTAGRGVPGAPKGPRSALPGRAPPQQRLARDIGRPTKPPAGTTDRRTANEPSSTIDLTDSIAAANKSVRNLEAALNPPVIHQTASAPESRKRTRDGKLKEPPNTKLKKASKMPAAGSLVYEWQIVEGEPSCPWLIVDHASTSTSAVRLHKEIIDFYEHVKPCDFEERIRTGLVRELGGLCRGWFKDADVYAFGSFMSGLYLPNADMDLVVCSDQFVKSGRPKYNSRNFLYRFNHYLETNRCAFENEIEIISRAKVPLVKYIERKTGLKMDVSFEKMDGVRAIDTFNRWKRQYPAMPILVTLVKHFLMMRGLNEPVNGGIGGFSVICLVVSMLQMNPQVQSRNLVPEHHLGQMLLEFFDLYGNRFNYETTAIRLNPPGYISKVNARSIKYKSWDRLSIIDPNNPENDITGGASNTALIMRIFSEAFKLLRERMAEVLLGTERNASILKVILAGNYSNFRLQREHLREIDEKPLREEPLDEPNKVRW